MIRKFAFKSMMAEKFRCVCTIIAMVLTALLFSTLFTTAVGLNSANDYYTLKQLGTKVHFIIKDWDADLDGSVDKIRENELVSSAGCRKFLGYAVNEELNYNVEFSYMDEANAENDFYAPTAGRLPEAANEIAVDTTTLEALGAEKKIGAPITLDISVGDETETEAFILSGWFGINEAYPNKIGQILASREYCDVWSSRHQDGPLFGSVDVGVYLKDEYDIEGQAESIVSSAGLSLENSEIRVNPGYNVSTEAFSAESVSVIVCGALIIILIGYLIINNIFYISARKDAKQFGRLKTIGMSNKHLAAFVRYQAMYMMAAAIPLGIVGGYFMGRAILPSILRHTAYDTVANDAVISGGEIVGILAFSALFVIVTTLVSIDGPIRMIKRLSPIESTRIELKGYKKKRRSNDGSKARKFAGYNIMRNKKSFALLLVSISLPVLLVIVSYDALRSFDMDKYLSSMLVTDYTFSTADYYKNDYVDFDGNISTLDSSIIDEIQNSGYVEDGSVIYADLATDYADISGMTITEDVNCALDIYGAEDFIFDKSMLIEDEVDMTAFNNGTGVIEGCWLDKNGEIYPGTSQYAVGDTFTITGKDGTPHTYTVLGHVDMSVGAIYLGSCMGDFTCDLYFNPEQYELITGNQNIMSYEFNIKEGTDKEAETFVKGMVDADNALNYQSKYSLAENFASMQKIVRLISILLCAVLTFIALMNLINVFVSSIMVREKEIATLKSIGMTRGQLRKMLMWEIFYYNGSAFAAASVLSLILSGTVLKHVFNEFDFFTFRIGWASYPVIMIVIMLVGALTVLCVENSISDRNITEELKTA